MRRQPATLLLNELSDTSFSVVPLPQSEPAGRTPSVHRCNRSDSCRYGPTLAEHSSESHCRSAATRGVSNAASVATR